MPQDDSPAYKKRHAAPSSERQAQTSSAESRKLISFLLDKLCVTNLFTERGSESQDLLANLVQLRDVLHFSSHRQWRVFDMDGTDLLSYLMRTLSRLVIYACHHRIQNHSPFNPPLALQSVLVDILPILKTHIGSNLERLLEMCQLYLPGIESFAYHLRCRLLSFCIDVTNSSQSTVTPTISLSVDGKPSCKMENFKLQLLETILATSQSSWDTAAFDRLVAELINAMVTSKHDFHVDLFRIIAHAASPIKTRNALTLLGRLQPRLFGHTLTSTSHSWSMSLLDSVQNCFYCKMDIQAEESAVTCSGQHSPAHVTCLNDESCCQIVHFLYDRGVKIGALRYSASNGSESVRSQSHNFQKINLFSLTLCKLCSIPLWGIQDQAYRCTQCNSVYHDQCRYQAESCSNQAACQAKDIMTDWSKLRASFGEHYQPLLKPENSIITCSFEEIAVLYCVLRVQREMLDLGVTSGVLLIEQKDAIKTSAPAFDQFDAFELQYYEKLYDAYLKSGRMKRMWTDFDGSPNFMFCESQCWHILSKTHIESPITTFDQLQQATSAMLGMPPRISGFLLDCVCLKGRIVLRVPGSDTDKIMFSLPSSMSGDLVLDSIGTLLKEPLIHFNECGFSLLNLFTPSPLYDLDSMYLMATHILRWIFDLDYVLKYSSLQQMPIQPILSARSQIVVHRIKPWMQALQRCDCEDFDTEIFGILIRMTTQNRVHDSSHAVHLLEMVHTIKDLDIWPGCLEALIPQWMDLVATNQSFLYTGKITKPASQLCAVDHPIWHVLTREVHKGKFELEKTGRWLSGLSALGVEIPPALFMEYLNEIQDISTAFLATIVRPFYFSIIRMDAQSDDSLAKAFMMCFTRVASALMDSAVIDVAPDFWLEVVRMLLAGILLTCRIQPELLEALHFVTSEESSLLHSTSKRDSRRISVSSGKNFLKVEQDFVDAITLLGQSNVIMLRARSGQFLFAFLASLNPSSLIEQQSTILQSVQSLIPAAYRCFDPALAKYLISIRMPLLIKCISVSPRVFSNLLETILGNSPKVRLFNLDYLHSIATSLEVDPDLNRFIPATLSLRTHLAASAIVAFFNASADSDEKVRMRAITLAKSLTSSQLRCIAKVLSTAFRAGSESERILICHFSVSIVDVLPQWSIFDISTITDALSEVHLASEQLNAADYRLDLLLLGLAQIDEATLAEAVVLKLFLVQKIGFKACSLQNKSEMETEILFSGLEQSQCGLTIVCLRALKKLLSSCSRDSSKADRSHTGSINSPRDTFLDIPFRMINETNLQTATPSYIQLLLDVTFIAIYTADPSESSASDLGNLMYISVGRLLNDFASRSLLPDVSKSLLACLAVYQQRHPRMAVNLFGKIVVVGLNSIALVITRKEATSLVHSAFDASAKVSGRWPLLFRALHINKIHASSSRNLEDLHEVLSSRIDYQDLQLEAVDDLLSLLSLANADLVSSALCVFGNFVPIFVPASPSRNFSLHLANVLEKLPKLFSDLRVPLQRLDITGFIHGVHYLLEENKDEASSKILSKAFASFLPIAVELFQISDIILDRPISKVETRNAWEACLIQGLQGHRIHPPTSVNIILKLFLNAADSDSDLRTRSRRHSSSSSLNIRPLMMECFRFLGQPRIVSNSFDSKELDLLLNLSRLLMKSDWPVTQCLLLPGIECIRVYNLLAVVSSDADCAKALLSISPDILAHSDHVLLEMADQLLSASHPAKSSQLAEIWTEITLSLKLISLLRQYARDVESIWLQIWPPLAAVLEGTLASSISIASALVPIFAELVCFLNRSEWAVEDMSEALTFLEAFQRRLPACEAIPLAIKAIKNCYAPSSPRQTLLDEIRQDLLVAYKKRFSAKRSSMSP